MLWRYLVEAQGSDNFRRDSTRWWARKWTILSRRQRRRLSKHPTMRAAHIQWNMEYERLSTKAFQAMYAQSNARTMELLGRAGMIGSSLFEEKDDGE